MADSKPAVDSVVTVPTENTIMADIKALPADQIARLWHRLQEAAPSLPVLTSPLDGHVELFDPATFVHPNPYAGPVRVLMANGHYSREMFNASGVKVN